MYLVRAGFIEETLAGKPMKEAMDWIDEIIPPSIGMLEKASMDKKTARRYSRRWTRGYFCIGGFLK